MVDKNEATTAAKKPRHKSRQSKNQQQRTALEKVTADFAACGRCSYFWAGYRVIAGEAAAQTAVGEVANGWLTLTWPQPMRTLVHKSYGVEVDAGFFHYEGSCHECRRVFVCIMTEAEEVSPSLAEEAAPETAPEAAPETALEAAPEAALEAAPEADMVVTPTTAPTSTIDLEKYNSLDDSRFQPPLPGDPPTNAYIFRIQLALPGE